MIYLEPNISNTCIVIITYHPRDIIKDRIDELAQQYNCMILVDNNSTPEELGYLNNEKLHLIKNNSNMGIAHALNQGLEKAEELGYKWVVTMDQDSRLFTNAIEVFSNVYKSYPNPNQLAMIAGNFVVEENIQMYTCLNDALYSQRDTIITSGCLTNISVWREIGGFNNGYFIDNVDDEFCLRASLSGYKTLATKENILEHQIGEIKTGIIRSFKLIYPKKMNFKLRTFGPYIIKYSEHSPIRWYYQGRNITAMLLRYNKTHKIWCKQALRRHIIRFFTMMIIESNRYRKSAMYLKGVMHGLLRKSGPI